MCVGLLSRVIGVRILSGVQVSLAFLRVVKKGIRGCSLMVKQAAVNRESVGSSPASPATEELLLKE